MKRFLSVLGTVTCLAVPAVAAENNAGSASRPNPANEIAKMVWPAESRHGTISKIDSARRVITMKDTAGVPFDFVIEPSTKITSGAKDLKFSDLLANEKVTIQYTPKITPDVAEKVEVGS